MAIWLVGCTVVMWSDNATVMQDTGVGDDKINVPKRIKDVYTK